MNRHFERLMQLFLVFCISAFCQTINITGTVVDSITSQGITKALVKLVEYPQCTTRTAANGSFSLSGNIVGILNDTKTFTSSFLNEINLRGNTLLLKNVISSSPIIVDIFSVNGSRIYHAEKAAPLEGKITFQNLWKATGIYFIKLQINGIQHVLSGFGTNKEALVPNFLTSGIVNNAAKKNATYTLQVLASGYAAKNINLTGPTVNAGFIRLSAPKLNAGTGNTYKPQYLTNVTGGGAFPDISNGYTCNCDGTGATDATACLQNAINQAYTLNKPLLIPYTSGFYKIGRVLQVKVSMIGIGAGMPTIKQANTCGQSSCSGLQLVRNMSGWIYNLHIVGTYTGASGSGEWAHNILVGGDTAGVTIKGCLLENPMGDNISDGYEGYGKSKNVIVDNNTMNTPRRCNFSLTGLDDGWVFTNNVLLYTANYVNPIDLEPDNEACYITNVEIGYNKITSTGAGQQYYHEILKMTAYFDKTPGGNIYAHHNYGTWGVKFASVDPQWTNVVNANNVAGSTVPK